jgi:plasmid stabilization system protein ParE
MNSPIPPRLYKHEQAKRDLIEIYAYLSGRNDRAAQRFLDEARKTCDLLLRMPGIGRRWKPSIASLPELRVTTLPRPFRKYLIFYRPVSDVKREDVKREA